MSALTQELRTMMKEDLGIAVVSSGGVALVGGVLWGMSALVGSEVYWLVDVRRFERNTMGPAREAAKKSCREKVGL